ncbi:anti-sigma factor [Oceanobacillus halophilus]|uniref:Anti-sigma factor n=1 Tax=Oceanobacillus halophilus TaxID=930130 RepID=A0A495A7W0_9BACI|nr:anti-sigma factor [Oceanobacillus halophilus]RKQ35704.1 anti-sigma factor [Oceanobacillus halophilus]
MSYNKHVPEEWMIELALGNISNEKRDDVLQHINRCEACRTEFESWKQIFSKQPSEQPTDSVKEKVWKDFQETKQPVKRKRKSLVITFAISSAAAIFFLAMGLIFYNPATNHSYQIAHNENIEEDILNQSQTKQVAVIPVADFMDVSGNLWINDSTHEMLLEVDGLNHLPDHDYQLWIVYKDDEMDGELLSIQDGASRVFFKGKDVEQLKLLKASVEPLGGSVVPTGPETFVVPVGYED